MSGRDTSPEGDTVHQSGKCEMQKPQTMNILILHQHRKGSWTKCSAAPFVRCIMV